MSNRPETIAEATAAIEAAGIKTYDAHDGVRVYDPSKRGQYVILEDGYSDADGPMIVAEHRHSGPGKVSGSFKSQLREILGN